MKVYLENNVLRNPTMYIPHFNGTYKVISPEVPKNFDKDILVKIPVFPDNAEAYERYFKAGIKSQGMRTAAPISPHFGNSMKTNDIRRADVRGKSRIELKSIAYGIQELNTIEFSTVLMDNLPPEEYDKFFEYRDKLTGFLERYGHLYDALTETSVPITFEDRMTALENFSKRRAALE